MQTRAPTAATALLGALIAALPSTRASSPGPEPKGPSASTGAEARPELPGDGAASIEQLRAEIGAPAPHQIEAWSGVTFRHAVANREGEAFALGAGFLTRFGLSLGAGPVAYALALDFEVGGADTGFAYEGEVHVLGAALRWSPSGVFRISGGVGVDGIAGAVTGVARFPVEVMAATELGGSARLMATATWDFTASSRRVRTPSMDVVTAFRAGLWVRFAGERSYWPGAAAGGGPAIGILYREWQGTRYLGVALTLASSGSQEVTR